MKAFGSVVALALLGAALGACSLYGRDAWVGQNLSELTAAAGPPFGVADVGGGGKEVFYEDFSYVHYLPNYCTATFRIDAKGVIEHTDLYGNNCDALAKKLRIAS
ncbi:MAG: hypothetical protein U1F33_12170 [Alphaproteobacteria bacterium]